ncbi:efflux transporter outer membrane subunit [Flavihumibacter solisilvae]|uniref:RND transporter n=1 Tax=Flavihumibacter solisilvae TaxID=1349421 RepID=A0A0C1ILD4_9BACT|nr:efflux transporter outer membrane subunit [Flavihumibacter solisilvae]KIC95005.1 RND transporter [Flavihumibacter solisilvae]
MKYSLVMLVLVVVLNACTVSRDRETPQPDLPGKFRNEQVEDSVGIGAFPWKVFYTDPLLQVLIDSGLVRNYDMQVALNNIEISSLQLRQSMWGNIPEVGLQVGASASRQSGKSLNGLSLENFLGKKHVENYTAALSVSWEADIWGKVKNQKKAALASYLQTGEARRGIQTRLVAAIAQGYYNLLILDQQVDIAERNLKLNDSTLRLVRLQYDAGQVTIVGVQQVEAQRLAAAGIIPHLHEARLVQENALSVLTGKLPGAIHRSAKLSSAALPVSLSAGLPAAMLSRRPDVKSRELDLAIANAEVGIAKASMYPSFRITASGGAEAFQFTNWFNVPASLFGVAAGSISQPILQRRQLKTQFEIKQVERETAVLRFRQVVLTAVGEVSDALAQVEQLEHKADVAGERLNVLNGAVHNAGLLFQNGQATYLEVITAQAGLLQSELELAAIKKAQLDAAIELYRSLGGGH